MKVLSLLQPWASLVVLGFKKIETRSWNTKYRGPLLIHASAGKQGLKLMDDPEFKKFLTPLFWDDPKDKLPLGAIIGQVNLTETFQFGGKRSIEYLQSLPKADGRQEIAFGDWNEGRWGWKLENPVEFPAIIPAKGQLGIWEYNMPEKIGFNLKNGGHASFEGMPDQKTVEAFEEMVKVAKSKLL